MAYTAPEGYPTDPSRYWRWDDPRWGERSPGQYGYERQWNELLKATNFDLAGAFKPVTETVEVPTYDNEGYYTGTQTITRPKMTSMGETGEAFQAYEFGPERQKAIDALRAKGFDIAPIDPDAENSNEYIAVLGPGNKVLYVEKIAGQDLGGFLKEGISAIGPMALSLIPGVGQTLGAAILGQGASAAASAALGNALIQGGFAGLKGGNFEDVLKAAAAGGLRSLASPYINELGGAVSEAVGGDVLGKIASNAVTGAAKSGLGALLSGKSIEDALLSGGVRGLVGAGTGTLKDVIGDYLKYGSPEEGFFEPGGPGYMGADLRAEGLEDIYGDDSAGVTEPEYTEDIPSIRNIDYYTNIDPLGELKFNFRTNSEGDYLLDEIQDAQQTPDIGGQPSSLWDTSPDGILAGREDEFLPEGLQSIPVTGKKLPPKDIIIPDWDRQDVIIPDWDINPPNQTIGVVGKKLPPEEDIGGPPGRPEDTSPGGGTTGREDEVLAPAPTPAPSPAPAPRPAPTPTPAPQADTGVAGLTPQQYAVLNAILAGKMGAAYDPYLLGKAARERKEKEASLNELMAALGFNQQA